MRISLMFCGYRHLNIENQYKFTNGKVLHQRRGRILVLREGNIWISKDKFKEMEWRYNHRNKEVFDLLAQILLGADN
jgi:hypothetical protein